MREKDRLGNGVVRKRKHFYLLSLSSLLNAVLEAMAPEGPMVCKMQKTAYPHSHIGHDMKEVGKSVRESNLVKISFVKGRVNLFSSDPM